MIAFDNANKYAVIDLEAKDGSETTELFDITTGVGGHMPRYITEGMNVVKPKASLVDSAQIARTGRPETC